MIRKRQGRRIFEFWGAVSRINPQIDADNRTFSLEILIPNDDHRLKPGAFARASVQTHVDSNVVFAPQEAIVSFAGVNKVFTVKDNKAAEFNVDPGDARAENNNYVEIATGLNGDEQVVVSGTSKLATGVPVVVKAAATQATSMPSARGE